MNELNVGNVVSLSYAKDGVGTVKVYVGRIETVKENLITLALGQGAYKSFRKEKIVSAYAV